MTQTPSEPTRHATGRRIVFALLPALLLFALIEVVARLFTAPGEDVPPPAADVYQLGDPARPYLVPRERDGTRYLYSPHFPSRYYRNVDDESSRYLAAEKTDRTYRVFTFGGSSTAGSPFGHWASFTRFVGDELRRVLRPAARVEVLNFGLSGGRSHEVLVMLRGLAVYRPDLVVLYTGENENCRLVQPRGVAGALHDWLLAHSRAYGRMSPAMRAPAMRRIPADPFGRFDCGSVPLRSAAAMQALEQRFSANVEDVVEIARGLGAEVLLLSALSNLFVAPVSEDADEARRRVHQLAGACTRKDTDEARRLLAELRGLDPVHPFADYYEGLLALEGGDAVTAATALLRALDHDRSPRRYRPSFNRVLSQLAETNAHVAFVDVLGKVRALLDDGLIDGRLVMDAMHPTLEGNRLIAQFVLEDFFAARNVRPDLFDYTMMRAKRVFDPVPEERHYVLVCERYYNLLDWDECIVRATRDYDDAVAARDVPLIRRNRRLWEYLYYYGTATGQGDAMKRSEQIYRSKTAAARPGG